MSARQRPLAVAAIVVAVAAGIGAALWRHAPPLVLASGTAIPEPRPIAEFDLVDQQGRAFRRESFEGRWSLVFTGFTHCPDICPTTLATMAELGRRLGGRAPQLVFVSVDPERDTPAVLSAWLAHFGPGLTGATGSRGAMEAFTASLGFAQVRNPGVGGEYTVDHSTALALIDPEARVAGYFPQPHDAAAIAADLAALPPAG